MIPQYMRFYGGYTLADVMSEYAVSFFALCNEMLRLGAVEALDNILIVSTPHMDNSQVVIDQYLAKSEGYDKILEEIEVLRNVN